jgi:hypothetical protein
MYAVKMVPGGMICISTFMIIGSGIQVILGLLPQQVERLQCWYCLREGFMKYAIETASGA